MELYENKRPPDVQIKLVEAIGIIMRIPFSSSPSRYKAPLPTNYDGTVNLLMNDLSGVISELAGYSSSSIPNDIARDLYAKTLEPGFGYDEAVLFCQGCGLLLRDLFNSVFLIVQKLQDDNLRIPIRQNNVYICIDGSRSSYTALDIGIQHTFSHGLCSVGVMKIKNRLESSQAEKLADHFPSDIRRRCKEQYIMADHEYNVEPLVAKTIDDTVKLVSDRLTQSQSNVLVLGVDVNKFSDRGDLHQVLDWAAWKKQDLTLVLAKSCCRTRPFTELSMPRVFMCTCVDVNDMQLLFEKCLAFVRPADVVVLHCVAKARDPVGDNTETRFGFGTKSSCWIDTEGTASSSYPSDVVYENEALCPGWNDEAVDALRQKMLQVAQEAQIEARARVDVMKTPDDKSTAQVMMDAAFEEGADMMIIGRNNKHEVLQECIDDALCGVSLVPM